VDFGDATAMVDVASSIETVQITITNPDIGVIATMALPRDRFAAAMAEDQHRRRERGHLGAMPRLQPR
jgi:hypothetical protein